MLMAFRSKAEKKRFKLIRESREWPVHLRFESRRTKVKVKLNYVLDKVF